MARKDRARARKRHAIERARREAGTEPKPKPTPPPAAAKARARPTRGGRAGSRPGARAAGGSARPRPFATKAKAGDLDPRGRVRTRDMLVHPRITIRVILIAFALALPGALLPLAGKPNFALSTLTFVAFALSFVGLADMASTKRGSVFMLALAGLSLLSAISPVVAMIR